MAPQTARQQMIPYLDHGVLKYAPAQVGNFTAHPNNSDLVSLLHNSSSIANGINDEEDDALQRFTVTGRPMPAYKPSALENLGMWNAPQFLPQRFTDDSVVPVVVILKEKADPLSTKAPSRRKSIINKIKTAGGNKIDIRKTKVVFMPRRDYLKYFAKDNCGNYIGTEPEQEWTEEQLEEKFKQYKKYF